jgi:hypothetical protein
MSERKPNMYDGNVEDIRSFVTAVVGMAAEDHRMKRRSRSGREITLYTTSGGRLFHERMASGIYNNTRHTLELFDEAPK